MAHIKFHTHPNRLASGAPELSIEYDILAKLKERIVLARSIDAAQHTVKKKNHQDKWLRETAEALEIDIDSDHDGQGGSGRRFDSDLSILSYGHHPR